ncbi:MAG: hypothetical protein JWO40_230 [Candidatus Doudnabacteria bacterium]|nr:hypothetical protein [Candidatus Doudnabacteria bacterium]
MPTKKTTANDSDSDELEAKPKSKKKVVRKVKKSEGPDLSSLPNNAGPVQMDSVAKVVSADSLHNSTSMPAVVSEQMVVPEYKLGDFSSKTEDKAGSKMEPKAETKPEIKPEPKKEAFAVASSKTAEPAKFDPIMPAKKSESKNDATFLIPEKFGFDLKSGNRRTDGEVHGKSNRKLAYFLIVLIILLIAGLLFLNKYSSKLLKTDNVSTDVVTTDNSGEQPANSGTPAPGAFTVGFANVPSDLQPTLTDLLQKKFGSDISYSTYSGPALPAIKADTLFVKSSVGTNNTAVMNALADLGIKAEIQQMDNLSNGAVLALTPTIVGPDLSSMTAAVYNASGVSGLAKKYCATLTAYKVTSCNALNATSNQTGTTVNYKNPKALFILKRTADYQKVTFAPADSKQVEDIRVTIGK